MEPNGLQETISNYGEELPQEEVKASKAALRRAGAAIRASKGFALLPAEQLPGGGLRLQAKVTDAFGFVDHPRVELDPSGEKVSGVFCDCPTFRLSGGFCAHCAALLEDRPKAALFSGVTEPTVEAQAEPPVFPEVMDLSYRFCNSAWDLYPMEDHPRIPLERFKQVYGNNAAAIKLYNLSGAWGGSCFGMVATSAMLHEADSGVELQDFLESATCPSDLQIFDKNEKLGLDLRSFIEAVHILQYGYTICDLKSTLETLADATEAFQKGEGRPVCMAIYKRGGRGGHAIMPYRIDRTDGPEDVLHIYDPNCPMRVRYGYLTKDQTGKYVNWRFAMYDDQFYGSEYGGKTMVCHYDTYKVLWDSSWNSGGNLMVLKSGMALVSAEGALMARVTQEGVETFCEDVVHLPSLDAVERDPIFSVPVGPLQVVAEDPEQKLFVSLIGRDLSLELSTDAREAIICVDDQEKSAWAKVKTAAAQYEAQVLNTFEQPEETVLRGVTTRAGLQLLQKDGRLYAGQLDPGAALFVNRRPVEKDRIGQLEEEETQEQTE